MRQRLELLVHGAWSLHRGGLSGLSDVVYGLVGLSDVVYGLVGLSDVVYGVVGLSDVVYGVVDMAAVVFVAARICRRTCCRQAPLRLGCQCYLYM